MTKSKLLSMFFLIFFSTAFDSSTCLSNVHKCFEEESEALLLFKNNLSSINDTYFNFVCHSYYPIMMNWNTSADCCNWDGITCDDSTGDVINLDLSCGMLKGTILREVGRFSNSLTHLNLSSCSFSGQVSTDMTLLHKLVSLDLSFNSDLKLRPHVFSNLINNLEELSLGDVNISSVLPVSLNISSSLKLLNLQNTGMKGKLPDYIFNLHSLGTLDLAFNGFTGNIPLEIPVNLTHLTYLRLQSNKLNGTLPSWLFTSPSLVYFSLSFNMFSGKVPFESFSLPSLERLDLSNNNQLVGNIDVQTFQRPTNLTSLRLSFHKFSGEWELDTLLSSLTNLEYLDLSYSGFSVTTNNVYHYVNPGFRSLKLASCKLKVFPKSFQDMKQLEELGCVCLTHGFRIRFAFGNGIKEKY